MGIPNDTNFTNTPQAGFKIGDISEQTIYVRVQNKTTRCVNNPTSFKVIVNPIPSISTTITAFPVCDVVTPSDGDPRNRIAQNIDLTSKNDEILAGKINHRVAYYLTQQMLKIILKLAIQPIFKIQVLSLHSLLISTLMIPQLRPSL